MTPYKLRTNHSRLASRTFVGLVVAASLALSACGDDTTDPVGTDPSSPDTTTEPTEPTMPNTPDTNPPSLDGLSFLSTATSGFDLVAGSVVQVTFADGTISVQAGCNSMGGDYSLDGTTLVIGSMYTTEMACEQPLMDQDSLLAGLLGSSPTIALDGDTLTITSETGSITLLDREVADPDRPLEGTTWTLDTILTGDAAGSVPSGVTATITIVDGRARVAAGCNTGSAAVTITDGTIEFGPMALTKMACGPEAMEVEQAVTSVLSGATTFEIDAGRLTITSDAPGSTAMGLSFTAGA